MGDVSSVGGSEAQGGGGRLRGREAEDAERGEGSGSVSFGARSVCAGAVITHGYILQVDCGCGVCAAGFTGARGLFLGAAEQGSYADTGG
jgi:hypothetical protein